MERLRKMIISVKRKKYDQRFESWYDTKSKWFYVHIIDQGITIDFSPKTFRTFLEYLQSINLEKDFEQLHETDKPNFDKVDLEK
jgi:hypothetical protein